AAFGKVPVFGPSMENFASMAARFVESGAAIQVESPEDAGVEWIHLLKAAAAPWTARWRKLPNTSAAPHDEFAAVATLAAVAGVGALRRPDAFAGASVCPGHAEIKAPEYARRKRWQSHAGRHGQDPHGYLARRAISGRGQARCNSQPRLQGCQRNERRNRTNEIPSAGASCVRCRRESL